jgi:hypothetical protein
MTHYITPYTARSYDRYQAVCGTWILLVDFDSRPSCPACRTWIANDKLTQQELDPTVTAEDVFGAPGE